MGKGWIAAVATLCIAVSGCSGSSVGGPARSPSATGTSPAVSIPASPSGPTRAEMWTEDVQDLMERMAALHPDLYHGVSKSELDAAAATLVDDVPSLRDDQILVGVMQLVAMVSALGRDGHMGVWPPENPDAVHRYPIRLWEFPDGLYVTAVRAPSENLAGSRLTAIDGMPIDEVLQHLDPVVPRDNDSNLRAARMVFLTSAEVLSGLGIASSADHIDVEVTDPATRATRTATIEAVDAATFAGWVGGWELLLPARDDLLLLQDTDADVWTRYLFTDRALYVQYNHVDPTSSDAVDEIDSELATHHVDRIVLDLRNNGGGEAEGYRQLLDRLADPSIDRPGRLFVLIGRLTFSAGASFVAEIERDVTRASFVGEPTGGAPDFWADVTTVTLPNSGLKALVSTTYEGYGRPGDPRLEIEPDVPVDMTAADYFAGQDPVLEAALAG
jgi:Peptidase family S41